MPFKERWLWIPTSTTLIYGHAGLVDTLLTIEQSHALVEWVAGTDVCPCKNRVGYCRAGRELTNFSGPNFRVETSNSA
jgi:hypothetical protein